MATNSYCRLTKRNILCGWFLFVCVLLAVSTYSYRSWKHLDTSSNARSSFQTIGSSMKLNNSPERGISNDAKEIHLDTAHTSSKTRSSFQTIGASMKLNNSPERGIPNDAKKITTTAQLMSDNKTLPTKQTQSLNNPSGKFVHIYGDEAPDVNAKCIDYKMLPPLSGVTKLCIHNKSDDIWVSGKFWAGGYWEKEYLTPFGTILKAHPDMVFLDLGSHMGMFTMYANKAGNRAIAVDPLTKNLNLLRKSVKLVHQEENVTILNNALSNKHEEVYVVIDKTNIGGSYVMSADQMKDKSKQAVLSTIQTIMIDDLLEVFDLDHKEVLIKLDVESYEWNALQGGYEFFRRVNVCYVTVEYNAHKGKPSGMAIVKFMGSFNLLPYGDFYGGRLLSSTDTSKYPVDVVFIKNSTQCKKH